MKQTGYSAKWSPSTFFLILFFLCGIVLTGCGGATRTVRTMEVTAYCSCGQCCGWERGSWKCLKLDFWNKYINTGTQKGQSYTGLTASGTRPREPRPGLFSIDSVKKPWMIPIRIAFSPWLLLPRDGTIAADTRYYPFGTRLHIPGYGYGVVEDRGSAIKGPDRLDIYYGSHSKALVWGRKRVKVEFID